MPLQMIRADITKLKCDAIVNAANSTLLGGGGVDGAIHRAAGPDLLKECMSLGGCDTGAAKLTLGYNLPCKYVIHTVGPIWRGGGYNEEKLLYSCYFKSLELAYLHGCKTLAFPLISSGAYGYPKAEALKIAMDSISSFLFEHDMLVYLVIFDPDSCKLNEKLFADIENYIEQYYEIEDDNYNICESYEDIANEAPKSTDEFKYVVLARDCKTLPEGEETYILEIQQQILDIDESFSQMVLRKIDEKGMSDVECYKNANVDRKLFSKLRSNVNYRPSKSTAIAFAIALELGLEEAQNLLMKAGYALSHSNEFDIIIEFFIKRSNYDIFEINQALFAFDQNLLGSQQA